MARVLAGAAAGLLLCVTSAFATEITGAVGAGPTLPVGKFRESPTGLGFHGDISLLVGIGTKGLSLRGDLFAGTNPYSDVDGGTRTLGAMLGVEYPIRLQSPVKPYAIGGFGGFNVHWAEEIRGDIIYSTYSQNRFGLFGGAGAGYAFRGVQLFAEVRVVVILTSESATPFIPLTVGVRFSRKKT